MKLPILFAGGMLALAACATEDGAPVRIDFPDLADRATRCEYYGAALDAAEEAGVAYVVLPVLDMKVSVTELRALKDRACTAPSV